jgi:DNA polymerase-1
LIRKGQVNTSHKWLNIPREKLGIYNYWDCVATARVEAALHKEMIENSQWEYYSTRYFPNILSVMEMAKKGILVDRVALRRYGAVVRNEITITDRELRTLTGLPDLNPNSGRQVADLLHKRMGLKCTRHTPSGGPSVDQEALDGILKNLRKKDPPESRRVLELLFHRSRYTTIASRYLEIPTSADGRTRPTVKCGKVPTLRLAYADPALQQFPPESRHLLVAKEGHQFIAVDHSQLEPRIGSVLSNDRPALDCFAKGEDYHKQNTLDLFGWGEEDWERLDPGVAKAARSRGKSFILGMDYGGKAETVASRKFCPCPKCAHMMPQEYHLTRAEMAAAEARYWAKHPERAAWREAIVAEVYGSPAAAGKGYYTAPTGYKRYFYQPKDIGMRSLMNHPLQHTAAQIVMDELTLCMEEGIPLVMQWHDELIAEAPAEKATETARQMKEIMERPVGYLGGSTFPVTVKVGKNLRDLEEITL